MKPLLNIYTILLVVLLPALECYAQGKKVDFVKTLVYSPVNYEVKSDTNFYLSSINWDRSGNYRYYSKRLEFNSKGKLANYKLSCDVNLGNIHLFWNEYYGSFLIDYTISDTIKGTNSIINFEFASDTLISYSLQVDFNDEDNTTHFFKMDSSLIKFYKNWLLTDAGRENTFKFPDFFDFTKFPIEKIRRHYLNTVTLGDTSVRTQYYIDSSFQNGVLSRDSLFVRQDKSLKIHKGNETISYLAHILPESIEIESYTYDTILKTTNQRMLKTHRDDTLYDIKLKTRLEGSNFISDYVIEGNHTNVPILTTPNRILTYSGHLFDTLRKREIHIVRDSIGKIISGSGKGISSKGEKVESRLVIAPVFQKEGFELRESRIPSVLQFYGPEKSENRLFEIISTYPNLDLRPLSTIQLINRDGIIGWIYPYQTQKARKVLRRYRAPKSPTFEQYIWQKTEKIKSADRKVKIRKEEGYNEYTIYEFHYF